MVTNRFAREMGILRWKIVTNRKASCDRGVRSEIAKLVVGDLQHWTFEVERGEGHPAREHAENGERNPVQFFRARRARLNPFRLLFPSPAGLYLEVGNSRNRERKKDQIGPKQRL